jgi:hypothetical protein
LEGAYSGKSLVCFDVVEIEVLDTTEQISCEGEPVRKVPYQPVPPLPKPCRRQIVIRNSDFSDRLGGGKTTFLISSPGKNHR